MQATLEQAVKMASKLKEEEQEILASYWIREMKQPNFLEIIKDELNWEKSFAESQDELAILADQALSEIEQGKAEEIDWDKL